MAYQESLTDVFWKYFQLTIAAVLGAASLVLFLVPADVVPQGVSGIATLLNHYVDTPIGVMILILNIPIAYLGFRMLPGGWRMTVQSIYVIVLYSLFTDLFGVLLPENGYTDDRFINTLFGGILGGVSGGIVYRTGTNYGGTSVIALILQRKLGLPLSQTFLYTDTFIVVAAGLTFGVEGALYAMVMVFLGGVASDYVMEGPSVIRNIVVITEKPEEVANAVMAQLERGVTYLPARGMYSGKDRGMLYITVSRSQVNDIKQIIAAVDEAAFMVIGQGHTAYGSGFKPISNKPGKLREVKPLPTLDTMQQPTYEPDHAATGD